MSEEGVGTRNWRLYIEYMVECGERVLCYAVGLDRDAFVADGRTYDAIMRNIELIGESATRIPDDVREAHPEIEWRSIIGTRQHIIHASLAIDNDVVWDIVQTDIPDLLPNLRRLLASTGENAP